MYSQKDERPFYRWLQMNSLACAIMVVLLAAAAIGGLLWIGAHPQPRVF
jgi:hypothetical protein